jgi:hypothetical protein
MWPIMPGLQSEASAGEARHTCRDPSRDGHVTSRHGHVTLTRIRSRYAHADSRPDPAPTATACCHDKPRDVTWRTEGTRHANSLLSSNDPHRHLGAGPGEHGRGGVGHAAHPQPPPAARRGQAEELLHPAPRHPRPRRPQRPVAPRPAPAPAPAAAAGAHAAAVGGPVRVLGLGEGMRAGRDFRRGVR